jgi:two-component system, OmpR family, sensor kinase
MFLNSIRWRLQLWYGVILVAVLAGFGTTAYQLERNRRLRSIDEELQQRMSALTRALQLNAPQQGGPDGFQDHQPPPPEDEPGHGKPPENFQPRQRPRNNFTLAPQDAALFATNAPAAFYYFIRSRDGALMSRSGNAPSERINPISVHIARISAGEKPAPLQTELQSRTEGPASSSSLREISMTTPPGEYLVVGRSIEPDLADLRHFAWTLAGVGGVVLLCGLAGGWVLATRAIRPIEDISATAVKIAAGDLSQRIDATDTDNELGRLAGVLNSTFARLEASFAQQGQFTADAAHELRTPVSVLLMQTQTVLKHERNSAEYRACIEACQRAAQRMRGLLESLLELARLDSGQEPMKKMRFDLARAVSECVELVRPLAQERNIKIETELPALDWTGDMERIAQVITNLLTNAIQYNNDGGEVHVNVREQNHEAQVTVSNTGIGISETDLPRIFERFYRADKSRSNAKGRTGLGLAISKAIVEAHGGNIEVASQPGKGTTFTVRLPARD